MRDEARGEFEARFTALGLDTMSVELATDATISPESIEFASTVGGDATLPDIGMSSRFLPLLTFSESSGSEPAYGHDDGHDLSVIDTLGEGGMGRVLLAWQRSLQRQVAVKILKPELDSRPELSAALLHEARVAGALEHPAIIPVHALGIDRAGRPVMIQKRVDGVAWRELLVDPAHPAWRRVGMDTMDDEARMKANLEVLIHVCNALEFAHERGVVHRDVKPDNVMVGYYGEVYLLDWGVAWSATAKTGNQDALVGTPAYMAPEMFVPRGRMPDARTDVYLLGATLHEVLTGFPRHRGASLREVLECAHHSAPFHYGPSVPAELAALANQACTADPGARPPSARAFREALRDHLRHRASIALTTSALERLFVVEELSRRDEVLDPIAFARYAGECRFGLQVALRDWPENALARDALNSCLECWASHELACGNVGAARMLVAELPTPSGELVRRLEALEIIEEEKRVRAARFAELEAQHDARIGALPRKRAVAGVAAMILVVSGSRLRDDAPKSAKDLFRESLIPIALLVPILWFVRAWIRRTAYNRHLATMIVGVTSLIAMHRALALQFGLDVAPMIAGDMLLAATVMAYSAMAIDRWLFSPAVVVALGSLMITVAHTPPVATFETCALLGGMVGCYGFFMTKSPSGRAG